MELTISQPLMRAGCASKAGSVFLIRQILVCLPIIGHSNRHAWRRAEPGKSRRGTVSNPDRTGSGGGVDIPFEPSSITTNVLGWVIFILLFFCLCSTAGPWQSQPIQKVQKTQPGMCPQKARAGVTHHRLDAVALFFAVTMDRAFCAGPFPVSERTVLQARQGITQQIGACRAQRTVARIVMIPAIPVHHGGYGACFPPHTGAVQPGRSVGFQGSRPDSRYIVLQSTLLLFSPRHCDVTCSMKENHLGLQKNKKP